MPPATVRACTPPSNVWSLYIVILRVIERQHLVFGQNKIARDRYCQHIACAEHAGEDRGHRLLALVNDVAYLIARLNCFPENLVTAFPDNAIHSPTLFDRGGFVIVSEYRAIDGARSKTWTRVDISAQYAGESSSRRDCR